MKKGEMLAKMLVLVTNTFANTFDKGGQPYVLHCLRVMHYLQTSDEELQCIALGHDLIEDFGKIITYALLREMGFTERVIEGIRCLTKIPGETYDEYKIKLKSNYDSVRVKRRGDLRDNSDIRRLKNKTITAKDIERTVKYHELYIELEEVELEYERQIFCK
jgi:(p)ppGpp synthase/HD superfamily hydrolase